MQGNSKSKSEENHSGKENHYKSNTNTEWKCGECDRDGKAGRECKTGREYGIRRDGKAGGKCKAYTKS